MTSPEVLPARRLNPAGTKITPAQLKIIKNTIAKNATNEELAFFVAVCERTGLNPLARQIHLVPIYDSTVRAVVRQPVVGIDGLRLIAERTGEYDGQDDPEWYDDETETWSEVWTHKRPPAAARIRVYRKGVGRPVAGVAMWNEYVQTKKDGSITAMWSSGSGKPAHMLAKCAEALALRRCFPNEMSGLYTEEELGRKLPADPEQAAVIDERADLALLRIVCELAKEQGVEAWTERGVVHAARKAFGRDEIDSLDALTGEELERILEACPASALASAQERFEQQQAEAQDGHGTTDEPPADEPGEPQPAIEPPTGEPGLAEQLAAHQREREHVEAQPVPEEPPAEPAAAQKPAGEPEGLFDGDDNPFEPPAGLGTYAGEPGQ